MTAPATPLLSQKQVAEAMDYTTRMVLSVILSNLRERVWDNDPKTRDRMVRLAASLEEQLRSREAEVIPLAASK